jgi:hypothetical protein
MKKKICSKCGVEKEFCEFHKSIRSNDGYRERCKECRKVDTTLYYQKNVDKIKENVTKYRINNPEKIKKGLKQYRKKNSEELNKNKRIWVKSLNGKKSKQKYYKNNSESVKLKVKEYKKNNPNKDIERRKSEKHKKYMKDYSTKYRKEKSYFILWRSVLRNTLKRIGTKKEETTNKILGYSAKELKEHIEKKFINGMSWENWGEWHLDHIKPVSSFDKSEKMSIINSLDNLQPLWAVDNLKKSNKLINQIK